MFNKTSKYETEVDDSVESLILSSLGYIESIDLLIIYGFTSRSRIFNFHGDVTSAGEGLQNLGLCSALSAFEQGGIFYRAAPAVTRDLCFFRSHPKDRPI
jgi:hypothetical protein